MEEKLEILNCMDGYLKSIYRQMESAKIASNPRLVEKEYANLIAQFQKILCMLETMYDEIDDRLKRVFQRDTSMLKEEYCIIIKIRKIINCLPSIENYFDRELVISELYDSIDELGNRLSYYLDENYKVVCEQ